MVSMLPTDTRDEGECSNEAAEPWQQAGSCHFCAGADSTTSWRTVSSCLNNSCPISCKRQLYKPQLESHSAYAAGAQRLSQALVK